MRRMATAYGRQVSALSVSLALLAGGCASEPLPAKSTGGEQPAPEESDGRLRFAWPAALHARVGVELRDGSPRGQVLGAASYELTTVATTEGMRIDFHDAQVQQPFALGAVPGPVAEQLARLRPSLRVDRKGALLGLMGVEARLAQALKALAAEPAYAQALRRRATPQALAAEAAQAWHDLVEFWPGRRYWIRSVAPLSLLEGEEVELVTTYTLSPGQPCDEYDPVHACVLLTVYVELEPRTLEAAIARVNQAAVAASEGKNLQLVPRVEAVEASTHLELLTEPNTLLPRSLARTRRSLKQVREAGELIEERTARHERHSYHYLRR